MIFLRMESPYMTNDKIVVKIEFHSNLFPDLTICNELVRINCVRKHLKRLILKQIFTSLV